MRFLRSASRASLENPLSGETSCERRDAGVLSCFRVRRTNSPFDRRVVYLARAPTRFSASFELIVKCSARGRESSVSQRPAKDRGRSRTLSHAPTVRACAAGQRRKQSVPLSEGANGAKSATTRRRSACDVAFGSADGGQTRRWLIARAIAVATQLVSRETETLSIPLRSRASALVL